MLKFNESFQINVKSRKKAASSCFFFFFERLAPTCIYLHFSSLQSFCGHKKIGIKSTWKRSWLPPHGCQTLARALVSLAGTPALVLESGSIFLSHFVLIVVCFIRATCTSMGFLETSSRFSRAMHPGTNRGRTASSSSSVRKKPLFFWDVLSPVCCVLMSNVLIHLKDGAKTAPLHTALPANPRHWLGADSKAAYVGLCATQSQVTSSNVYRKESTSHEHHSFMHTLSCSFLLQRLLLSWRPITS